MADTNKMREALQAVLLREDLGDELARQCREAVATAEESLVVGRPVEVTDDTIRRVFMAHGFTIKEGQTDLKPYVFQAARALLAAAAAQPLQPPRPPAQADHLVDANKMTQDAPVAQPQPLTDCNEAMPATHFSLSRANLDDLRRVRAEGLAAGPGSGKWIKAAVALMGAFPQLYDTAKAMNERQAAMRSAAADVVSAFETLGRTRDAAGLLVARSRCEAAMAKLSAALKAGHGISQPAAGEGGAA